VNRLTAAAGIEWLKIIRARIFVISFAAACMLPLACGMFLAILLHPEYAAGGLLAQKARIAGAADWASYFVLLNEMMSVGGIVIFGFITSWAFGREYADRTAKDLLALPMPRSAVVLAKYIALAAWCLLLTAVALAVAVALGLVINPPGFSSAALINGGKAFIISALLNLPLIAPVSFVASFGRGYLPPLGFIIFTVLLGQAAEIVGAGGYCPWDMPAIYAGIAGDAVPAAGYALYILTAALGFGAAVAWWRYADQQ